MTTPLRLRHPHGVSTIQASLADPATVADLQQLVFSVTEIPPSAQELKAGYPPHALTLIPSLPISSLGLKRGDQLIVTALASSSSSSSSAAAPLPRISAHSPSIEKPPPVPRSTVPPPLEEGVEWVECEGQALLVREVPDDNSCLFSACGIVLEQTMSAAPRLRNLASETVLGDPSTYTEAFLGHPPAQYAELIRRPNSWGGAIELALFSKHYGVEIASWDVETGRCDRFGGGEYDTRVLLVYSGIHYDAIALSPAPSSPPEFHQTSFPVIFHSEQEDPVLIAGAKLVGKLRAKRKYTNTATFDLKCEICGIGIKGEKAARQHANETGHAQFGEY